MPKKEPSELLPKAYEPRKVAYWLMMPPGRNE